MFKNRLKIVGDACLHGLVLIVGILAFILVISLLFLIISLVVEYLKHKFNLTIEDVVLYLHIGLYTGIGLFCLFGLYKLSKFIHWLIIEPLWKGKK